MQASPMGEIAEVQLLGLLLEVYADVDTQFQVWLSITFAVLVAAFIAGERFSRTGRVLVVALYACACTILFMRYLGAIDLLEYVLEVYGVYAVSPPPGVNAGVAALRLVLFPLGTTIAALVVLFPGVGFRRHLVGAEALSARGDGSV